MVTRRDTALTEERALVRLKRRETLPGRLTRCRHPWSEAWRVQRVGIDSEYDSGEAISQFMSMLVVGAAMAVLLVVGIAAQAFFETFSHKS